MRIHSILLLCLVAGVVTTAGQSLQRETCDATRSRVDVETTGANFLIGGLFEIRSPLMGSYACGQPHEEMIQVYEAARWALKKINDINYIPGIKLGMKAYDTCFNPTRAIQAVHKFYPRFTSKSTSCTIGGQGSIGLLGPFSSWTSMAVAGMTSSFQVSIVSPRAMSDKLSDKSKYPYFLRTTPSHFSQVKTMLEVMKKLNWKRVLVVYSDSDYGKDGYMTFKQQAYKSGITCITASMSVPSGGTVDQYRQALTGIMDYDVTAAVFFGSYTNTLTLFQALENFSNVGKIQWILSDLNLNDDYNSFVARGALVVLPKTSLVTEFRDYFVTLSETSPPGENPWYADWYMTVNNCRLPGVNYAPYNTFTKQCTAAPSQADKKAAFKQVPFSETTIKAVFALAQALRQARASRCGSTGASFCSSLKLMKPSEFFNILKQVNFQFGAAEGITSLSGQRIKFDNNGDISNQDFTVYNYNRRGVSYAFEEVGSLVGSTFTLDTSKILMYDISRTSVLPSILPSVCGTQECMFCDIPRGPVEFMYNPGDLVIGAVVNGHTQGLEPFTCGMIRSVGFGSAVAFHYAITSAKTALPGILNGITLGGLVADICSQGQIGKYFFNNLLGGKKIVRDKKGIAVDPGRIKAVIEGTNSVTAIEFSEGISRFGLPEVGSVTTMMELSDKTRFPNFLRAIPPDNKQIIAMTNLLATNNWHYIQTIQSQDSYGRESINLLRATSVVAKICITASYEYGTDGSFKYIVQKILQKPDARVVVIFLSYGIRDLFQAIKDLNLQRHFILIGSDTWGSFNYYAKGYEDIADGSLTFEPETTPTNGFINWLNTLNPRSAEAVPGFKELYQNMHSCYVDSSAKGDYPTECGNAIITSSPNFQNVYPFAYMINSVYAVAKGLDDTLKYFCGSTYSGVCPQFRANTTVNKMLYEYISKASFNSENSPFQLVNGEGNSGYNIFNYRKAQGYVKIGSYSVQNGKLTFDKTQMVFPPGVTTASFKSLCDGNCFDCSYVARSSVYVNVPGDIQLGGVFAVHNDDKFSCGTLRTSNGIQFVTAMMYAIKQVNSKTAPVSLNGVNLGTLILDHCKVYGRGSDLLSILYSGILPPSAGMLTTDLTPAKIMGWMSDNTIATLNIRDVIKGLNLPLISPFSSSESLSNRENFPTYFRTIQGDTTLSVGIAKLVKFLGKNFVTLVYSNDDYGTSGMNTFQTVATQEGVCVYQKYKMDGKITAAQVMQSIAASTSQVVVLWTNVKDSNALLKERSVNANAGNVLFIFPMPLMALAKQYGQGGGKTFTMDVKTKNVAGYLDYMRDLPTKGFKQNHFLYEYYMVLFNCDLPGYQIFNKQCPSTTMPFTGASDFQQDDFVVPTIDGVYAFTAALDATLKEKCGKNYNGICAEFSTTPNINQLIMTKMEGISFLDPANHEFSFVDREGNIGLNLMYFDGTKNQMVGDFAGASLHVTDQKLKSLLQTTLSSCPSPCPVCAVKALDFTYKPGDLLIGGIFDVHMKDLSPFSCGGLLTWHGFQLLEAFNYAVDKVNEKTGMFANILKNVKLGAVGLDSCQSAIRTGYLVSNIHNGYTKLKRDTYTVNPDDINAYIGAYSSDSSIYLARILKTLKIPEVSYAATSIQLLDQDKYPYFMRSVPADDNQAQGMVQFLNKYNIKYVQILHTKNNYGELGASTFYNLATQNKICVAQNVAFPGNGTVTKEIANDVVTELLKKPLANTVVVFADVSHINAMLNAIKQNQFAVGKLKFLGSEMWGNSQEAIEGSESFAEGSVTMTLDSSDLPDFDVYLGSKTPGNYPENPWFPEYYQEIVNCYLTVPDGKHTKQCTSMSENIVAQTKYIQDPGILHVINSVFATAIGIDYTLKEVCGTNYTTVCEKYRNDQGRQDRLIKNIARARFTDPSKRWFEFTARREGNMGYQVFSLNRKMTMNNVGFVYEKIGTFSSDKQLNIKSTYKPSWDGSCERTGSCSECPTVRNTRIRYMQQAADSPDAATLVALFSLHGQGTDPYRCGSLSMHSLQLALTFFFTIENLVPRPYKIRGLVLDYCGNERRIYRDLYSLLGTGQLCNTEFNPNGKIDKSTIAGVFTFSSSVTMAVNSVLAPLKIPILSSSASSILLSDKKNFPYFARATQPDNVVIEAIAAILKSKGWTYVSVLYSKESYGFSGNEQLQKAVKGTGVCIGLSVGVDYPSSPSNSKAAIQTLLAEAGSNVVVLFTLSPRPILLAAKELGVLDRFVFIGIDTWGDNIAVSEGMHSQLLGSLIVSPRSAVVEQFRTYVRSITYSNRKNIPKSWFEEFYQIMHKCQLKDAEKPLTQYSECTKNEVITDNILQNYPFVVNTIAATYSAVVGLNAMATGRCTLQATFKDCFSESNNWDLYFNEILKTKWKMQNSLTFNPAESFDLSYNDDRYWDIGIAVMSLMQDTKNNFYIGRVGNYAAGKLDISNYKGNKGKDFTSQCPPGKVCDCEVISGSFAALTGNETSTKSPEPRNYFFYNEKKDNYGRTVFEKLYTWPIWAIVTAVLTCAGLLTTLFLFIYFLLAYPIRGGTTVLGFMMMIGIMGIYAINFAFFLPATDATCGARRFVMGVVYAIVFAALLVKSMDNWRYSDMEYSVRKYKGLTNACSLFLVAFAIVCVELIIPIMWLILKNPTASEYLENQELHDWNWCDPHDMYDKSLVMSMIFAMFLVLLTAVFSALAWDSDSNYYESRWIFVGSVCTAGCFLVWMIVSTNAGPPYRDPAVALGNFVNATALLICIPLRKLVLLVYVKNSEEEDKIQQQMAQERNDVYSTVYSNPGYDGDMFQPVESKHSESDAGYDNHNL